jgi:hypothetical protein
MPNFRGSEFEARVADISEETVIAAVRWDESLHPRAKDGKFIRKGGWIRGLFKIGETVMRLTGQVVEFQPNPKNPDNPIIVANTPEGRRRTLTSHVEAASGYKAELTGKPGAKWWEGSSGQVPLKKSWKPPPPPKPLPVRIAEAKARVNAEAQNLSTEDPYLRAEQLNHIMSGVRGTPLSTVVQENQLGKSRDEWELLRAAKHERLWMDFIRRVEQAEIPKERGAVVMGGLPGAGKTWSLRPGEVAGEFGVVGWDTLGEVPEGANHVILNPDVIKELMIEAGMLPSGISPSIKPMEQVSFIHAESNYLVALFFRRLSWLGYNVVYDTTMANVPHMTKNLYPLAEDGYRFRGIYIDISYQESRVSALKRYVSEWDTPLGGRFVPSEAGAGGNNLGVFDQMKSWFEDGWMLVNNEGISRGEPAWEIVETGKGDGKALKRFRQNMVRAAAASVGDTGQSWGRIARQIRTQELSPEEALAVFEQDEAFGPDEVSITEGQTWEDEGSSFSTKSTLHHELYALADAFSQEFHRLRQIGLTEALYLGQG